MVLWIPPHFSSLLGIPHPSTLLTPSHSSSPHYLFPVHSNILITPHPSPPPHPHPCRRGSFGDSSPASFLNLHSCMQFSQLKKVMLVSNIRRNLLKNFVFNFLMKTQLKIKPERRFVVEWGYILGCCSRKPVPGRGMGGLGWIGLVSAGKCREVGRRR